VSWFASIWTALWGWLRRWALRRPLPLPDPRPNYLVVHVDDEPDEPKSLTIYAVGEGGYLWHITMLCPCGCGARISLNALPDASPQWTLEVVDGLPSIRPSVWRKVGCRSHFFVRRGRIIWC
jgi:hypothetical protein